MWSSKTIYDSPTSVAGSFAVYGGWQIYLLDIPSLGLAAGTAWQGSVGSLRLDPTVVAGQVIDIDWVRLVANDAPNMRTITWSGGGAVDIYLDTDTSESNGTLGLIATNGTTLSKGVTGGSFAFQPGALPPGNDYVAMRAAGTTTALRYSSGYWSRCGPIRIPAQAHRPASWDTQRLAAPGRTSPHSSVPMRSRAATGSWRPDSPPVSTTSRCSCTARCSARSPMFRSCA